MPRRNVLCCLVLVVLVLPLFTIAQAQEETIRPVEEILSPMLRKISVNFAGGPLIDLIRQVEKENGIVTNIVVSNEAARIPLPPIALQNVSLENLCLALQNLDRIDHWQLQVIRTRGTMTISARNMIRGPDQLIRVNVYDVRALLEHCRVEDLVTAIQTSWAMASEEHEARLKYHEETRLLIAQGRPEDLATVENVLGELSKSFDMARQIEERKLALQNLECELAIKSKMLAEIQAKLEAAEKKLMEKN